MMSENAGETPKSNEIQKLLSIATDMDLSSDLRSKSIELLGNLGTHEALLALLEMAANSRLTVSDRDMAIKKAREIIKSGG